MKTYFFKFSIHPIKLLPNPFRFGFCSFIILFSLFVLLSQCSKIPPDVAAQVKGLVIQKQTIDSVIQRNRKNPIESVHAFLEQKINPHLMYLEAKRLRLDKNDDTRRALNTLTNYELYLTFKKLVLDQNWGFTEKTLMDYYNNHPDSFMVSTQKTDSNSSKTDNITQTSRLAFGKVKMRILRALLLKDVDILAYYKKRNSSDTTQYPNGLAQKSHG